MDLTIIQQGRFISTGATVYIPLRSGVDWMDVYNYTVMTGAQVAAIGAQYYWQRGMANDTGIEYLKAGAGVAGANLIVAMATGGFTYYDSTLNATGALHTDVTAVSAAAIPVVTETAVNGLSAGDVIRLTNIDGAAQISGMDFTVGYSTLTAGTFSLEYMPQIVAGTTGNWQLINAESPFYPRRRRITAIAAGVLPGTCVIRTSVTHGYTVGQKVRISVPAGNTIAPTFGMVLPPTQATVLAINTGTAWNQNTITVDIDITGLAPFVFPLTAASPFTPAEVVPMGEDTGYALSQGQDILADSTIDQSTMGMVLKAGANSPAGTVNNNIGDVIYWKAGKSFNM